MGKWLKNGAKNREKCNEKAAPFFTFWRPLTLSVHRVLTFSPLLLTRFPSSLLQFSMQVEITNRFCAQWGKGGGWFIKRASKEGKGRGAVEEIRGRRSGRTNRCVGHWNKWNNKTKPATAKSPPVAPPSTATPTATSVCLLFCFVSGRSSVDPQQRSS